MNVRRCSNGSPTKVKRTRSKTIDGDFAVACVLKFSMPVTTASGSAKYVLVSLVAKASRGSSSWTGGKSTLFREMGVVAIVAAAWSGSGKRKPE